MTPLSLLTIQKLLVGFVLIAYFVGFILHWKFWHEKFYTLDKDLVDWFFLIILAPFIFIALGILTVVFFVAMLQGVWFLFS